MVGGGGNKRANFPEQQFSRQAASAAGSVGGVVTGAKETSWATVVQTSSNSTSWATVVQTSKPDGGTTSKPALSGLAQKPFQMMPTSASTGSKTLNLPEKMVAAADEKTVAVADEKNEGGGCSGTQQPPHLCGTQGLASPLKSSGGSATAMTSLTDVISQSPTGAASTDPRGGVSTRADKSPKENSKKSASGANGGKKDTPAKKKESKTPKEKGGSITRSSDGRREELHEQIERRCQELQELAGDAINSQNDQKIAQKEREKALRLKQREAAERFRREAAEKRRAADEERDARRKKKEELEKEARKPTLIEAFMPAPHVEQNVKKPGVLFQQQADRAAGHGPQTSAAPGFKGHQSPNRWYAAGDLQYSFLAGAATASAAAGSYNSWDPHQQQPLYVDDKDQVQYVLEERNKWKCGRCGDVLPDEKALRAHRASGFCRVNKDEKTLRTLRVGRYNEAKAKSRGRRRLVVQADVATHDGIPIKAARVFKYLGTQMDNGGGTAGEILRRTGTAKTVVQQLRRIWRDNSLPRHLKATLYGSLVSSVALYNAECWTMAAADWKVVKSFQFTTLKTMAGEEHWRVGQGAENGDESEEEEEQQRTSRMELCARLGVVDVETQLKEKRVAWVAHTARAKAEGTYWMIKDEMDKGTPWGKQVRKDLEEYGWTLEGLADFASAKQLREEMIGRRLVAAAKREKNRGKKAGGGATEKTKEAREKRRVNIEEIRKEIERKEEEKRKTLQKINGKRWARVPGAGNKWKAETEEEGEVVFEEQFEASSLGQRNGDGNSEDVDCILELAVPLRTLYRGGVFEHKDEFDSVSFDIPPLTKPGTKITKVTKASGADSKTFADQKLVGLETSETASGGLAAENKPAGAVEKTDEAPSLERRTAPATGPAAASPAAASPAEAANAEGGSAEVLDGGHSNRNPPNKARDADVKLKEDADESKGTSGATTTAQQADPDVRGDLSEEDQTANISISQTLLVKLSEEEAALLDGEDLHLKNVEIDFYTAVLGGTCVADVYGEKHALATMDRLLAI
eukprot:g14259.t1